MKGNKVPNIVEAMKSCMASKGEAFEDDSNDYIRMLLLETIEALLYIICYGQDLSKLHNKKIKDVIDAICKLKGERLIEDYFTEYHSFFKAIDDDCFREIIAQRPAIISHMLTLVLRGNAFIKSVFPNIITLLSAVSESDLTGFIKNNTDFVFRVLTLKQQVATASDIKSDADLIYDVLMKNIVYLNDSDFTRMIRKKPDIATVILKLCGADDVAAILLLKSRLTVFEVVKPPLAARILNDEPKLLPLIIAIATRDSTFAFGKKVLDLFATHVLDLAPDVVIEAMLVPGILNIDNLLELILFGRLDIAESLAIKLNTVEHGVISVSAQTKSLLTKYLQRYKASFLSLNFEKILLHKDIRQLMGKDALYKILLLKNDFINLLNRKESAEDFTEFLDIYVSVKDRHIALKKTVPTLLLDVYHYYVGRDNNKLAILVLESACKYHESIYIEPKDKTSDINVSDLTSFLYLRHLGLELESSVVSDELLNDIYKTFAAIVPKLPLLEAYMNSVGGFFIFDLLKEFIRKTVVYYVPRVSAVDADFIVKIEKLLLGNKLSSVKDIAIEYKKQFPGVSSDLISPSLLAVSSGLFKAGLSIGDQEKKDDSSGVKAKILLV